MCDTRYIMSHMQEARHTERRDALREGRVLLFVDDHDKVRLKALVATGGRVVGWVDGFYRVLIDRWPS